MNPLSRLIDRFFPPLELIKPGIYHYQAPPENPLPFRLHLRIEGNGEGTLIVNASTILHLNQTATEYAYHIVQQTPDEEMINQISRRYDSKKDQIRNDSHSFLERLHYLVETPDLDPVTFLDFERTDPYSTELSAPFRLDCALTYQINNAKDGSSAPVERVKRELDTEEWKTVLDKAWQAGIPHIIFTGGEPTLREDLVELIAHAEKIGQVTGLLTDGLKLAEKGYLDQLLQSGLDHLMIVLDPDHDKTWQAISTVTPEDIHTTVHLTITPEISSRVDTIIHQLSDIEVNSISLSISDPSLNDVMQTARQTAFDRNISVKWDLPVPYSSLNPVSLELKEVEKPADGAGKAWFYIEPDGDILAAQGLVDVLGNMLTDDWQTIWKKHNQ